MAKSPAGFYVTGGSLRADTPSYVARRADRDLYEALGRGEFCYVLTARQMGKSSLMVRTAARLEAEGTQVAVLDLTAVGQNLGPEAWYYGLLCLLGERLRMEAELEAFWDAHPRLGPLQRWMAAVEHVVLAHSVKRQAFSVEREGSVEPSALSAEDGESVERSPTSWAPAWSVKHRGPDVNSELSTANASSQRSTLHAQRLVIFIDEIDAVRSLPFSTDEFFAAIRQCYNRRSEAAAFERLTFCLLGVASPSDLICDTRTTPFNVGTRIELTDFTEAEADILRIGLEVGGLASPGRSEQEARALLKRVLFWTNGHPYLTQRLCSALLDSEMRNVTADERRWTPIEGELTPHQPPTSVVRNAHSGGSRRSSRPLQLYRRSSAFIGGYIPQAVDQVCEALFLTHSAREKDDNLTFVRERLLRSEVDVAALLELYACVRRGGRVVQDETNRLVSLLQLAGVTRVANGCLRLRNRIYERVFDGEWVRTHMPDAELRRQRAAFRRGLARAGMVASAVVAVISLLAITAAASAARAEKNRKTADHQATELRRLNSNLRDEVAKKEEALHRLGQALADARAARGTAYREARRANLATGSARQAAARANDAQERADTERNRAVGQQVLAVNLARRERTAREEESRQRRRAERGEHAARMRRYAAEVSLGLQARAEGDLAQAREMALRQVPRPGEEDLRGFEWRRLRLLCRDENWLTLRGYTGWNRELLLSPDGRLLAAQAANNTIALWEISRERRTARAIGLLPGGGPMALSPDGRFLFHNVPGAGIKMTNLATRKDEATFAGGGELALSPDGRRLATETGERVHVYDVASRQEIATLPTAPTPVKGLVFSPDGRILAGRLSTQPEFPPQTIRLWDARTWAVKTDLSIRDRWWGQFTFSPDGKQLALGLRDSRILLFDVSSPDAPRELPPLTAEHGMLLAVRYSPDGRFLASASADHTVRIWNLEQRRPVAALHGHEGEAQALAYSADGKTLASAGMYDGTIRLWDATPGPEPGVTMIPYAGAFVGFSPDGRTLASAGGALEAGALELWDPVRERRIARIVDRRGIVGPMAFSSDGRIVAGVIWLSDRSQAVHLWSTATTERIATLEIGAAKAEMLAFSPAGGLLATSLTNGEIQLWDVRSHRRVGLLKGHTDATRSLAFSPDGRMLASGGQNGEIGLWQVATQREIRRLLGHRGQVFHLAFAPDGQILASGGLDQDIRLWRVATGGAAAVLRGHRSHIVGLAFTSDGRTLASASVDHTVRLWHLSTMQQVAAMHIDRVGFMSVAFSPDGTLLATGSEDRTVRLWRAPGLRPELAGKTLAERASALFSASGGRDPSEYWSTLRALAQAGEWEKVLGLCAALLRETPVDAFLWRDRGRAYASLNQHEKAIADYSRAIALQPRYAEAWRNRGESYVALRQLERARSDFARLAELQPEDPTSRYELALAQLATGRREDYCRLCADLLDRFGSAMDPGAANDIAWYCSLAPSATVNLRPVVELAHRAMARRRNADNLNTLGAALYRAGQFEEAVRVLNEAVATGKEHGTAWDFLFLAMAHARLGHMDEAQRLLARVDPWVEAHLRPAPNSDVPKPLSWPLQLELRLLRREAEAVVAGRTPPEQALTVARP